jgi:hypothetical protein
MGLNCPELWKEESGYLAGELDAGRRGEIETHAAACPRCAAVVAGTRNIVKLYGDARMVAVPGTLHSGVRRRVSAHIKRRRGSAWGLILSFATAGAMSLLFISANTHPAGAVTSLSPMSQTAVRPLPPTVQVGQVGRLFHVKGCPHIHGRAEEVPVETALGEGLVPCARCLGEYLPHPISANLASHDDTESADNMAQGSW